MNNLSELDYPTTWRPGFDPDAPIPVTLTARQIDVIHTLINNLFVEDDAQLTPVSDEDAQVAWDYLDTINDLHDEHVVDNQIHPPCLGERQRMMDAQESN